MSQQEALRAQVEALRSELAALRAQLDALIARRGQTMAGQSRCPGCGGRRLLHLKKVLDRADGGNKIMSVADKGFFKTRPIGQFEIFVCDGCGLVEWYIPDRSGIEPDGDTIRSVDGSAPEGDGPYR